jgi:hypothetical protein
VGSFRNERCATYHLELAEGAVAVPFFDGADQVVGAV